MGTCSVPKNNEKDLYKYGYLGISFLKRSAKQVQRMWQCYCGSQNDNWCIDICKCGWHAHNVGCAYCDEFSTWLLYQDTFPDHPFAGITRIVWTALVIYRYFQTEYLIQCINSEAVTMLHWYILLILHIEFSFICEYICARGDITLSERWPLSWNGLDASFVN